LAVITLQTSIEFNKEEEKTFSMIKRMQAVEVAKNKASKVIKRALQLSKFKKSHKKMQD